MIYFLIGLGGALGAMARFGTSRIIARNWRNSFPLATFVINISGALALGLLAYIFFPQGWQRTVLGTGFLGAFTTFSTFSFEVIDLWETGQFKTAIAYALLSVIFGVALCYATTFLY